MWHHDDHRRARTKYGFVSVGCEKLCAGERKFVAKFTAVVSSDSFLIAAVWKEACVAA